VRKKNENPHAGVRGFPGGWPYYNLVDPPVRGRHAHTDSSKILSFLYICASPLERDTKEYLFILERCGHKGMLPILYDSY
jgi:hypothetical protein